MRTGLHFAVLCVVAVVLIVVWINTIETLSRDSLRVPAPYSRQGRLTAPGNTSAGGCTWQCGGGLTMVTQRPEQNLYVLESHDALEVTVEQWNDLLQCAAYEQTTRYNQTSDSSVCDSQAHARNGLDQQTVRRAIEFYTNQYFEITKLEPRILSLALAWKSLDRASWLAGTLPVRDYYPPRDVTQECTAKYECATGNGPACLQRACDREEMGRRADQRRGA